MTYGLVGASEWWEMNEGDQICGGDEWEVGWIGCRESSLSNNFYFKDDAHVDGQNWQETHLAQVKVSGSLKCQTAE